MIDVCVQIGGARAAVLASCFQVSHHGFLVQGAESMISGASYFFFIGLALAIVYLYLGIRRGWGSTRRVIITGTILCAIAMALVQAANPGADLTLAIIYGVPLGALLGLATAGIAYYFSRNDQRSGSVSDE